ncbi:LPS export ABC transporter periplasmic protein LptC [Pseudohongiella sp. SYSU M77423]|uniref:LPS export ABC transporter periplasmic protein LptC n=1 Tax=unclassified Pseudohongiella TaxID=2629611 RepID=UPI001F0244BB|nr:MULTISPECIES: LPS export ABC transporter periplasmic protein LptC [unclassified Pseudohongiella]MDH7944610.1 LPS export ABC transporter periplasmic protein LptC [Pseudohongiella sp. SYSU M77423]
MRALRYLINRLISLRLKGWLVALAPAVLLAWLMTGDLDVSNPDQSSSQVQLPSGEQYEGFGRDIHSRVYNDSGELEYTIGAEAQRLYTDEVTELDYPMIRMFQQGQERWNISAVSGRIRASSGGDIQELELRDSVQVRHQMGADDAIQVQTAWLIVEPQAERLYTDAQVLINGNRIEQRSMGLRANFSLDSLEFLSDVEGRFTDISP